MNTTQILGWDTEYSADSAEFCPVKNFYNILAIGTYQLVDPESLPDSSTALDSVPKIRCGKLYLKEFNKTEKNLKDHQTIVMSAILDMKWCHKLHKSLPLLAVATSIGEVILYQLKQMNDSYYLDAFSKIVLDDCLALSIDFSNTKLDVEPQIVISDSKGKINIIEIEDDKLVLVQSFKAHEYEAWISAYNYSDPNVVFTGGDDAKFRCFDIRSNPASPVFTNKQHDSGVTSIHSSVSFDNTLATGSYDDIVRLWDTRNMRIPLTSINQGGGVWRLKWAPGGLPLLLCACMHNGFHIIDIQHLSSGNVSNCASFMDHESLAYGCDWYYDMDYLHEHSNLLIASVSFYDHLLCLWDYNKS